MSVGTGLVRGVHVYVGLVPIEVVWGGCRYGDSGCVRVGVYVSVCTCVRVRVCVGCAELGNSSGPRMCWIGMCWIGQLLPCVNIQTTVDIYLKLDRDPVALLELVPTCLKRVELTEIKVEADQ